MRVVGWVLYVVLLVGLAAAMAWAIWMVAILAITSG